MDTLLPFGDISVALVRPTGIVDIRIVDDREHRTLTSRMQIDELAWIAKTVFANVRDDTGNTQRERDLAGEVNEKLTDFIQWKGE